MLHLAAASVSGERYFQGHLKDDTGGTNHRVLDDINHLHGGLVCLTVFGFCSQMDTILELTNQPLRQAQ